MIFPYIRYSIEPTPTIPSGQVQRPLIPVRIVGPQGTAQVFGLLDTGADNVFVSASLAKVLGIELRGDAVERALGADSHEIEVWPGSVEIEITQNGEAYRWQTEVGFLSDDDDSPMAYLGQAGFLEHFKAIFDTEHWLVELLSHNHFLTSA